MNDLFRSLITWLAALFLFTNTAHTQQHNIIPAPVSYQPTPGYFYFKPTSYILVHDMASFLDAVAFRDMCIKVHNLPLKTLREPVFPNYYIDVRYDSTLALPDGGYTLDIGEEKVTIIGKNNGAVLSGLMTLLQMIESKFTNQYQIPCARITDNPQFAYRGMHLDCSRHMFSVDEIKEYIDHLALYKMNTFHWHLTDDQGWRIEIKKYPLLTEVGAWRDGSMIGPYRDQKFDSIRYGGYYTQEEIKEIVTYATKRNITVIPEIEMPGHCRAALAAYPQLGCIDDTTYTVGLAWGEYREVFCPKEETFLFLQNVLDEVMALFPGQYIHIGGDEVNKEVWRACAHCQSLIRDKGLQDEFGLQNYFVDRMVQYINSKGRKAIGWDEILQGGKAPQATIMSWRGEDGGIAAAKQDRDAIMTPQSHCYFDHYQGYPSTEPLAFGGYSPLEKVYAYQPIPAGLTPEEAKHIQGAQGNVWSEYLYDFEQVQYMVIPRMLALSEVLWSPADTRNYVQFMQRLQYHFSILDKTGWNYSKTAFGYTAEISPAADYNGLKVELKTWNNDTGFTYLYATDDMQGLFGGAYKEAIYNGPFLIQENYELRINETETSAKFGMRIYFNKATGKKTTLLIPSSKQYSGSGAHTITDGVRATVKPSWVAKEWLGFSGTDMQCVIDLGKADTVSAVGAGFLSDKGSWIYPPSAMEVSVSMDGKNYTRIGVIPVEDTGKALIYGTYKFTPAATRFVKVTAYNFGAIPNGAPGSGKPAWLFVDEVVVE